MEHKNNSPESQKEENWLDDVLISPIPTEEIGADEKAVSAAGLTHPDDLELERILAESWDEVETSEDASVAAEQPAELEMLVEEDSPVLEEDTAEPVEEPQSVVSKETAPVRKGRPARKKGYGLLGIPHILSTVLWLAIIVAIGVSLGRVLWVCCADLMAFGKESQSVTITITKDDDIESISQKLGKAGLVRYPGLFQKFAELTGKDERISVGTFTLSAQLDYNAMINAMTAYAQAREEVTIMFPEGYTCAQIFNLLEEKNVCSVEDLEAYAADGELSEYWFLEGVERGDKYCLEGYLFPDTYEFYTNDEPRRVIEKFLNGFDLRFTDLMKTRFEEMQVRYNTMLANRGYDQAYIDENALTIRKVIIIASLIEKETSGGEESYDISSVIYNRLTNQASYPFLNIDAALVYALGGKEELTEEDKAFDSPYNTYLYKGLIPGPISNPGRDSIYAALDPNDTRYYFYALNPETGKHHFTKTYDEHMYFLNSID